METEIALLVIAVAGALAITARAMGQVSKSTGEMAQTVKALNDELQEAVKERRTWEHERADLRSQLQEMTEKATGLQCDVDRLDRDLARKTGEDEALRTERDALKQTILNQDKEIGELRYKLQQAAPDGKKEL